jgi:EmrB/QacA subfamily drug resistance transporter
VSPPGRATLDTVPGQAADTGSPPGRSGGTARPGSAATATSPAVREPEHPRPPPAPAPRRESSWLVAVVVISIGGFMSVLDSSIVNVAATAIQKDFGASLDNIQWISTAYSLALGVIVPVSGWLGDRFGLRRTYNVSLLGFALGSVLCGLAWNLSSLVVFRIIQAIPGGILPVASLALLYKIAPPAKIGAAMGIYGVGVVFAPGIGPTLGGYLVQDFNWRLIFFINAPVGLIGLALTVLAVPEFPRIRAGRFDVWGFVTVAAALFAVLLALSEGQTWGWSSYPILILLAGSVNLLAAFVVIELHTEHPLIDVRVFAIWQFTNSLLLISTLAVGLFGVVFYIPLFLQQAQLRSPIDAGFLMLPEAIVMAFGLATAGKLYDSFGARLPSAIGLALAALGTYLLCGISFEMTAADVILWTCVRGLGNGLAIMPGMTAGLAVVPAAQINQASAINTAVQRITSAFGLAVLSSLSASQQSQFFADRSALLTDRGVAVDPRVTQLQAHGPGGLIPLWQRLQAEVLAQSYSNLFLVIAVVTAVGAGLALLLKRPPERTGDEHQPVVVAH